MSSLRHSDSKLSRALAKSFSTRESPEYFSPDDTRPVMSRRSHASQAFFPGSAQRSSRNTTIDSHRPNWITQVQHLFYKTINIVEFVVFIITFAVVVFGLYQATNLYAQNAQPKDAAQSLEVFNEARLKLSETVILCLSFILAVEVLKLFFVKTFAQVAIVLCLVFTNLIVSYFTSIELSQSIQSIKRETSAAPLAVLPTDTGSPSPPLADPPHDDGSSAAASAPPGSFLPLPAASDIMRF